MDSSSNFSRDDDETRATKRQKYATSSSSGVDACSDRLGSESAVPSSTAGSSFTSANIQPSSSSRNDTASSVAMAGDYLVTTCYNNGAGSVQSNAAAAASPSSLPHQNDQMAMQASTGHRGPNQLASYEEALRRLQQQEDTRAMSSYTSMPQHPSLTLSTGALGSAFGRSEEAASLLGLQPNASAISHQALLDQAQPSIYGASLLGQSNVSSSTGDMDAIQQQRMNALMLERMRLQRILQLEQQRNQLYNNPMGLGMGLGLGMGTSGLTGAGLYAPSIGNPLSLPISGLASQAVRRSRADCLPSGVPHYKSREVLTLSHANDSQILSDYLCFIRKEFLEVFVVTEEDLESGRFPPKNEVGQCGIRCRFCAHVGTNDRFRRSTAFPSSIRRIYQSTMMMLREHFPNCMEIPVEMRLALAEHRAKSSQGAKDAKKHWVIAAAEIGMTDNAENYIITLRDSPHQIRTPAAPVAAPAPTGAASATAAAASKFSE